MRKPKLTREQLEQSLAAKSAMLDLCERYLTDREFWNLPADRAQITEGADIFDAAWYRAASPDDGYVVIRDYNLTREGRRGFPVGSPALVSWKSLELSPFPHYQRLAEKLRAARVRAAIQEEEVQEEESGR